MQAHFDGLPRPAFDFTTIRPRGSPIRGFGGVASGPEVLQRLHADVDGILTPLAGQPITITAIVDLMNAIGRCIVSGDVRQTAEIAFGDPDSDEYIDLKDYDKNPGRAQWGWCRCVRLVDRSLRSLSFCNACSDLSNGLSSSINSRA